MPSAVIALDGLEIPNTAGDKLGELCSLNPKPGAKRALESGVWSKNKDWKPILVPGFYSRLPTPDSRREASDPLQHDFDGYLYGFYQN